MGSVPVVSQSCIWHKKCLLSSFCEDERRERDGEVQTCWLGLVGPARAWDTQPLHYTQTGQTIQWSQLGNISSNSQAQSRGKPDWNFIISLDWCRLGKQGWAVLVLWADWNPCQQCLFLSAESVVWPDKVKSSQRIREEGDSNHHKHSTLIYYYHKLSSLSHIKLFLIRIIYFFIIFQPYG